MGAIVPHDCVGETSPRTGGYAAKQGMDRGCVASTVLIGRYLGLYQQ